MNWVAGDPNTRLVCSVHDAHVGIVSSSFIARLMNVE
jgi:hypothetical protein